MTAKKDLSEMTNEEIARETWAELRERYGNLGSAWDQLTDTQRQWLKGWVVQGRDTGALPEYKPKP